MLLFEKADYISTFDLKSGYHHVDIHPQSQAYLGFSWAHKYCVYCFAFWLIHSMFCIHKAYETAGQNVVG